MAVLCLLPNTPWPRPTPAEVATARVGFPPWNAEEGERSEGLHKRSAEDEGGPCGRERRKPLRKAWLPRLSAWLRAEEIALAVAGGVGVAGRNRPAEVGGERRGAPEDGEETSSYIRENRGLDFLYGIAYV